MFKIQENPDGSTSVYHKKTGQHMCTIPVKPNSSSPLRINVVEPQPSSHATVVVKDWRLSNFKTKVPDDDSSTDESTEDDLKSSCGASSEASDVPDDPRDAFVRALDLVPVGDLGGRTLGQYPLRRVSRVDPAWPRLVTELTPLSCRLGKQLLWQNPKQNLVGKDQRLIAAVRKYEGLCVVSGLPEANPCHQRLRCRDRRLTYPICTTIKTMRAESSHMYSFGRRQRMERLRVIETGLDRRSRRLLELCRECEVRLEQLSKDEIKKWKRKRTVLPTPIPMDQKPSHRPVVPAPAERKQSHRPLSIPLVDITRCIIRSRDGSYRLAGTPICVLDYADFLAARRRLKKPPLKPKNSSTLPLPWEENIPLIDLTADSPPKGPKKYSSPGRLLNRTTPCRRDVPHGPVLRALLQDAREGRPTRFRCFACGHSALIPGSAEYEVLEHMQTFHSVADPNRFLTMYRDLVNRCTIVEAFPGFKGSND